MTNHEIAQEARRRVRALRIEANNKELLDKLIDVARTASRPLNLDVDGEKAKAGFQKILNDHRKGNDMKQILCISVDGFRLDNMEGYSQDQLDVFNLELNERLVAAGVEQGDDEYEFIVKMFSDEVARR